MSRFRKRPVVIEAIPLRDDTRAELLATFTPNFTTPLVLVLDGAGRIVQGEIKTLEGTQRVSLGDYIIRGVAGELYPCKPDIFAATYEPLDG